MTVTLIPGYYDANGKWVPPVKTTTTVKLSAVDHEAERIEAGRLANLEAAGLTTPTVSTPYTPPPQGSSMSSFALPESLQSIAQGWLSEWGIVPTAPAQPPVTQTAPVTPQGFTMGIPPVLLIGGAVALAAIILIRK